MKPIVLAFSGGMGSGKSTLSNIVATDLGWTRASFGDLVRAAARGQGLEVSRENLQKTGASLIETGWSQFGRALLAAANWKPGTSIVIDGIRHMEAIETLQQLTAPSKFLLVFVNVDKSVRRNRLAAQSLAEAESLERLEEHSTEKQVGSAILQRADLVVDGTRPYEITAGEIAAWVKRRSQDS